MRNKFPFFRHFLAFCLSITLTSIAIAQTASDYLFSSSQETYSYLAGGTTVPSIQVNNGISPVIPIGFSFTFAGSNYTDIKASTEGWITFNTAYNGSSQNTNTLTALSSIAPALFPLWDDLTGFNDTTINPVLHKASYLTSGSAPNRIFTFEWKNWGQGNNRNYVSFQIKLFETSNKITFVYNKEPGCDFPANQGLFASIGIGSSFSGNTYYLNLEKAFPAPIVFSSSFLDSVDFRPSTAQVYNFLPPTPCIGLPSAGNIASYNSLNICAGTTITLLDTGYSLSSGLGFQWQYSLNNGTTWTDQPGANQNYYQPAITTSVQYRVKVTCLAASQTAMTAPCSFVVGGGVSYNSLPYSQDFESWISNCGELDIPGEGWKNAFGSGDLSWRRDDQTALANWTYKKMGYIKPGGDHYARTFSSQMPFLSPSNLDFHVDCSARPGLKGLYFTYSNPPKKITSIALDLDTLYVLLSTNGGSSFSKLATFDTTSLDNPWDKMYVPVNSNSANTIIRFQGINYDPTQGGGGGYGTDIAVDSVFVLPACTGSPLPATISSVGMSGNCPGEYLTLAAYGGQMAGDLTYQWEQSIDGGNVWTTAVGGNNKLSLEISLYDTTMIRLKTICNGSGQSTLSNVLLFNVSQPTGGYAALPFIDDFENWMSQCDSNDVPGSNGITNWTNNPAHGVSSCRRDDQGNLAGWDYYANSAMYSPPSVSGFHSARFATNPSSFASLNLLINCSSPGPKELQFYLNMQSMPSIPANETDSLKIWLSTNGGIDFTQIGSYRGTVGWDLKKIEFNSNASETVIRFAPQILHTDLEKEIGIDLVKVVLPCAGQPYAGVIDSVSTCAGKDFFLKLAGATEASGLEYQWQTSANGTSWTNIFGGTENVLLQNLSSPSWFRCILSCNSSGLADTTPPKYIQFLPFYYCYCDAMPFFNFGIVGISNIEEVALKDSLTQSIVLDNGNLGLNGSYDVSYYDDFFTYNPHLYSNYQFQTPAILYRDTSYQTTLMQTLYNDGYSPPGIASLFIDFNRDGVYDTLDERVFSAVYEYYEYVDSGFFRVPLNAQPGYTGMRAILKTKYDPYPNPFPGPCDYNNFAGEVEDYIVKIEYAPCNGPLNPGAATLVDSFVCTGVDVRLSDTSHDNADQLQASQLLWLWEASTDGVVWADVSGSEMIDKPSVIVSGETWYRLKMICQASHDTSYSNSVHVTIKPPYRCYCYSRAEGKNLDRGDIGNYTIGGYSNGSGGAHLNNPQAIESYTDYGADTSMVLYSDSTYDFSAFHIMKTANHQNARVTVFMDFNNNFQYDIPSERVFTGTTTATNFLINNQLNIPSSVSTNALTGMRIILNQNFQPNIPSDSACGPYISGETEDYVVKFIENPLVILGLTEPDCRLMFYPNPTEGKLVITYNGTEETGLEITVLDITGRELLRSKYSKVENGFKSTLDLSGYAKGVYMIQTELDHSHFNNRVILK